MEFILTWFERYRTQRSLEDFSGQCGEGHFSTCGTHGLKMERHQVQNLQITLKRLPKISYPVFKESLTTKRKELHSDRSNLHLFLIQASIMGWCIGLSGVSKCTLHAFKIQRCEEIKVSWSVPGQSQGSIANAGHRTPGNSCE